MSTLLKRQDEAIVTCVVCRNLLELPILLGCLHNVCASCIGEISAPPVAGSGPGRIGRIGRCGRAAARGGSSAGPAAAARDEQQQGLMMVTCPRCKESYNMDAKSRAKTNMHVAARIAHIQTELQLANRYCSVCRESHLGEVHATHHCPECRLLLCEDCTRDHARFLRGHPVVATSEADVEQQQSSAVAKTRECGEHGQPLAYFCKTCNAVACTVCIQLKCSREEHRFAPAEVACEEAKKELMAAVNRVTSSPGLRQLREQAAKSRSLLEELQVARRSQLEALQRKRLEAMRNITEVYERAEQRMLEQSQRQEDEAIERAVIGAVIGVDLPMPDVSAESPIVAECVQSMEEMLAKFIESIRFRNLAPGNERSATSDSSRPPSS